MPLFISYSHQDREFVDRLAVRLVNERANVWLDRWELRVGESLLDRIQEAIGDADALLVVLSPAAVSSEWCRRELNAGLVRELEESQVLVLPLLVEDCEIPLFLREKYYADFREGFETGIEAILQAIAGRTSTTLGRMGDVDDQVDYAIDWFTLHDRFLLRLTIVQVARANPYTILIEIDILTNEVLTRRYRQYDEAGLDWVGRGVVLEILKNSPRFHDMRVLILDDRVTTRELEFLDPRTGVGSEITVTCRRLGVDTGMDVLAPVGPVAVEIMGEIQRRMRPLTTVERERVDGIRGQSTR